jgi:hypothetical protein
MMQHYTLRRQFCFAILGTAVLMIIKAQSVGAREFKGQERDKCDVHHETCTKSLANCEVSLDIHPKPVKAMRLLSFQVTISGGRPSGSPFIDLGMPGMDMGPNPRVTSWASPLRPCLHSADCLLKGRHGGHKIQQHPVKHVEKSKRHHPTPDPIPDGTLAKDERKFRARPVQDRNPSVPL